MKHCYCVLTVDSICFMALVFASFHLFSKMRPCAKCAKICTPQKKYLFIVYGVNRPSTDTNVKHT